MFLSVSIVIAWLVMGHWVPAIYTVASLLCRCLYFTFKGWKGNNDTSCGLCFILIWLFSVFVFFVTDSWTTSTFEMCSTSIHKHKQWHSICAKITSYVEQQQWLTYDLYKAILILTLCAQGLKNGYIISGFGTNFYVHIVCFFCRATVLLFFWHLYVAAFYKSWQVAKKPRRRNLALLKL